jgi:ATP-dependent DNA helicase RecG
MREDFTMPRNPTIARIFRAIKLSENAGSGFDKMFSGWKVHYGMEPIVSNSIDFYKIEFPLKKEEIVKETTYKEPVTGDKTREKIISLIKENPEITTNEMVEKLNISVKGVEWQIKNLKDKGILKRIGPDKGGYWKIIEK